ncbi:MAG: hypothetical protein JWN17_2220 [Frankiales bacterium]|nr:hypothetical protein [Frankiales bacterium]
MTADHPLAEATRKSGLVWVRPAEGGREQPVWHVWHDDAAWVVTGGLEQPFPDAEQVEVVVRSRARQGDRLGQWSATVEVVAPGAPGYDDAVRVLHAERLNAPDGEEQPARWARGSRVLRLRPASAAGA